MTEGLGSFFTEIPGDFTSQMHFQCGDDSSNGQCAASVLFGLMGRAVPFLVSKGAEFVSLMCRREEFQLGVACWAAAKIGARLLPPFPVNLTGTERKVVENRRWAPYRYLRGEPKAWMKAAMIGVGYLAPMALTVALWKYGGGECGIVDGAGNLLNAVGQAAQWAGEKAIFWRPDSAGKIMLETMQSTCFEMMAGSEEYKDCVLKAVGAVFEPKMRLCLTGASADWESCIRGVLGKL